MVKTLKRKKPDGSIVEEQTMQVKPGVRVFLWHFRFVILGGPSPSSVLPRVCWTAFKCNRWFGGEWISDVGPRLRRRVGRRRGEHETVCFLSIFVQELRGVFVFVDPSLHQARVENCALHVAIVFFFFFMLVFLLFVVGILRPTCERSRSRGTDCCRHVPD